MKRILRILYLPAGDLGAKRKMAKIPFFFIALIVSKTAQYMFSLKINLITIDRIRDNYLKV